jgi:DNA polymerase-1
MLLQIHDELVFEVPEKEVEKTEKLVKKCMESVMKLDVPLVVNISVGKDLSKV